MDSSRDRGRGDVLLSSGRDEGRWGLLSGMALRPAGLSPTTLRSLLALRPVGLSPLTLRSVVALRPLTLRSMLALRPVALRPFEEDSA